MAKIHLYITAACAIMLALAILTLAGDPDMLQDVCVADLTSHTFFLLFNPPHHGAPSSGGGWIRPPPLSLPAAMPLRWPILSSRALSATGAWLAGAKRGGVGCGRPPHVPASFLFQARARSGWGLARWVRCGATSLLVENWKSARKASASVAEGIASPSVAVFTPNDYWRMGYRIPMRTASEPAAHASACHKIIFVLEGTLKVGFITTANKLVTEIICKAEQGTRPAAVVAAFNSQLQGTQAIAMTLSATSPVSSDILAKAFRIDNGEVDAIKAKFAPK
ncbi:germin-like protein 1-1 [Panicum miliaceum]|uniref:Germin-like protein 1-1 n=1 Tax=Panicum miliaceum TaxID=4540 RepID=A0A3L6SP76_PANMI|nr:germin-like protein 1-1 [Panicum miliaceum]